MDEFHTEMGTKWGHDFYVFYRVTTLKPGTQNFFNIKELWKLVFKDILINQKLEIIDTPNFIVQDAERKLQPHYHYRRVKFGFRTLYIPLSLKVPKCNLPYHN